MSMQSHDQVSLRIDAAIRDRIDALAHMRGTSPTEVLQEALDRLSRESESVAESANDDDIFAIAERASKLATDAEWASLPTDLAKNFDHYHYGHPREE